MKKLNKKQLEILKKYWKALTKEQAKFYGQVYALEAKMSKEIGIADVEFFWCDGYCGIGNTSKTIELIYEHELED